MSAQGWCEGRFAFVDHVILLVATIGAGHRTLYQSDPCHMAVACRRVLRMSQPAWISQKPLTALVQQIMVVPSGPWCFQSFNLVSQRPIFTPMWVCSKSDKCHRTVSDQQWCAPRVHFQSAFVRCSSSVGHAQMAIQSGTTRSWH